MNVLGDVYDIASRVKAYDPSYELNWNPNTKQYRVIAKKRVMKMEGDYNGHPLFSMHDHSDIVFNWEVKGEAPDQRIIWKLYETDTWRHPRGAIGYLEDFERETAAKEEKRQEKLSSDIDYVARENHDLIFQKKKSYLLDKVVV